MTHQAKIVAISEQIKIHAKSKTQFRINHGHTHSTRRKEDEMSQVDITDLNEVISVDTENLLVHAEANVTMQKLCRATLAHNLIPKVVMEFPKITVGGGIQGGSGESSSFKFGLFHEIAQSYTLILADGTIVEASEREHGDLYHAVPGSMGTLAVLVSAKLSLVPAKKYVCVTGTVFRNPTEFFSHYQDTDSTSDYRDGIILDPNTLVLLEGTLTNEVDGHNSVRFTRPFDDWFFTYIAKQTETNNNFIFNVPIDDYLFRYDRGGFWTGKHAIHRLKLPFNRITRFIMDPLVRAADMYYLLPYSKIAQQYLAQDVCVPALLGLEFFDYLKSEIKIYPIWICPLAVDRNFKLSPTYLEADHVINFGLYGGPFSTYESFIRVNRSLEKKALEFKARKVMYAHYYTPEEEFWLSYDQSWYDSLRQKYSATNVFPNLFQKIFVPNKYLKSKPANWFYELLLRWAGLK